MVQRDERPGDHDGDGAHAEGEVVRILAEHQHDQEHLDASAYEQQAHLRSALAVQLAPGLGEQVTLGHFGGGLSGQHGEGQPGACNTDNDGDADERAAPAGSHGIEHVEHRGVIELSDLGVAHVAVGEHGAADVDEQQADQADDGSLAHLMLVAGAGAHDRSALDADEHPHHDDHAVHDLLEQTAHAGGVSAHLACGDGIVVHVAPEVGGEDAGVEHEDGEDQEDAQGGNLRHHDDSVQEGGALNAADDQEGQRPHEQRGDDYARQGVAGEEGGEEVAQRGHHHRGERDVAQPCGQPVTPAGNEAGKRAEALLGVLEDALELGLLGAQVVQRQGKGGEADTDDCPGHQHGAGAGDARKLPGDGEHAGTDAGTDDHADQPEQADAFSFLTHDFPP